MRAANTEDGLLLHMCHVKTPFETTVNMKFVPHGVKIGVRRGYGLGGDRTWFVGHRK